jgi:N-methylhydantoinase B
MKKIDPVTLEVVSNHLISIVREMATALMRTSYSTIIREMGDYTTALFGAEAELIAQAEHIPSHQGTLSEAAKTIFRTVKMEPEDVVIFNHPYEGGTHHPDIMIFKPVFADGEFVGMAGSLGHHIDVGGRSPGSASTDALDVFEEGLMIPALKIVKAGQVNEDIFDMIRANIRVPHKTLGDIRAQMAAVALGERRLLELFAKYGRQRLSEVVAAVIDNSERLMREDLGAYKDGTYTAEGFMDGDGISDDPVRIVVTVTIDNGSVTVDYTGSSPQVKGPFNCAITSTHAATWCGVRYMVSPLIPQNEGCYRPIKVIAPEGTIVRPTRPAPLSGRFHTLERMTNTIVKAFNQARGENAVGACHSHLSSYAVSGTLADGEDDHFVFFDLNGGGWGGTPVGDGLDATKGLMSNSRDCPIESLEIEYPLRMERYELLTDSAGAGKQRGGVGFYRVLRFLHGDGYFTNRSDGQKFAPEGVLGGNQGTKARHKLIRADGTVIDMSSKVTNMDIHSGDLIHFETVGGGGYGNPADRAPEKVLDDVLDGLVSAEQARDIYRVAVDVEKGVIDDDATAALRAG